MRSIRIGKIAPLITMMSIRKFMTWVELKVKLVGCREKFEEDFDVYKIARTRVQNVISKFGEQSKEDLKKNEEASIYLESLEDAFRNLEIKYDHLRKSLIEVTNNTGISGRPNN